MICSVLIISIFQKQRRFIMNKVFCLLTIAAVSLVSCDSESNNPLYDEKVQRYFDKYLYNNMRFVCEHSTENDISKYSRAFIDVLEIKNADIIGENSVSEYTINYNAFKYVSCIFGFSNKNDFQDYGQCTNSYDKDKNYIMCLRFPELTNSFAFPTNITIRFYIELPIALRCIIEPIIWAPNLDTKPDIETLKITQEYYLWNGWDFNNPAGFASKFRDCWVDDHYVIQNEYTKLFAFYTDKPSSETPCDNESFFGLTI